MLINTHPTLPGLGTGGHTEAQQHTGPSTQQQLLTET